MLLASVSVLAAPAAQAAGPLKPLYGNLRPFYGNLRPFYGNLRPFYGNLRPFWGNLQPFWGNLRPFWGDLSQFWGVADPVTVVGAPNVPAVGEFWTATGASIGQTFDAWRALDPATAKASDYNAVASQLRGIVGASRDFWGPAVQAQTGKSFDDGFAQALLAKYGIDPDDASTLRLDATGQASFFLEWYDGLMAFSGTDRVDHWMRTANWTPALSREQGYGEGATVGLLDMTVVGDAAIQQNIVKYGGVSTFTDGHGVAVASLMVGAHDGRGVMGIAPGASVVAYNPFDATGTANWTDVTKGVQMLKASGAGVVNASLGVPGKTLDQGWNGAFSNLGTTLILKNTVFVIAAGNEGASQNWNIEWNVLNPAFLVVGSVDVNGEISNFSNRPGTGCLTLLGLCLGDKLMNHFLVAPGELILVDDDQGGVTRQIGTSFAAPLVSGAIGLIQGRWPWLVNSPGAVVDIILKSAKDLGAPGADPVYGRGLLDITAAMSPLNFNSLVWYQVQNGKTTSKSASQVLASYRGQDQAAWDASGAYFYAFEPLGLLTRRDFAIPLSQRLVGQTLTASDGSQQMFQSYLLARMDDWAGVQGYAPTNSLVAGSVALPNVWGADLRLAFAPRQARYGFVDQGPGYQMALKLRGERSALAVGFGDGAPALAGASGFTQAADYDIDRGGADPLLGLASGGLYAGWSYGLDERLQLSVGALQRRDRRDPHLLPALDIDRSGARTYDADAQHVGVTFKPASSFTLTGAYTRLHEGSGLLGVQSLDAADFRHGATTDGYSLGVSWAIDPKLTLAATGAVNRTRSTGDQGLGVDAGGLSSSAYQVTLARQDLIAAGDRLTLSLSQPMHVERGRLTFTGVQVVDRQTGELGVVTQAFEVSGPRRHAYEAVYLRPVSGGRGDLAFIGRIETQDRGDDGYAAGARYRLTF